MLEKTRRSTTRSTEKSAVWIVLEEQHRDLLVRRQAVRSCSNHMRYDKPHIHNSSGKQSWIFQLDATAVPQTFNKYRRQVRYEYSRAEMSRLGGLQHQAHSALPQCCRFTILHSIQSNSTFRTTKSRITVIIFILLTFFHFVVSCFPFLLLFLALQLLYNRLNLFVQFFFFRKSNLLLFTSFYLHLLLSRALNTHIIRTNLMWFWPSIFVNMWK